MDIRNLVLTTRLVEHGRWRDIRRVWEGIMRDDMEAITVRYSQKEATEEVYGFCHNMKIAILPVPILSKSKTAMEALTSSGSL